MSHWPFTLLAGKAARPPARRVSAQHLSAQPRPVRLELEALEDRLTPTVTYHGGALLPHVEVQALYLGSDWVSNATYRQQMHYLDGFLNSLVTGPYMDMLTTAGYRVGRGSATPGATDPIRIDRTVMLTDADIQVDLQLAISAHLVLPPDPNRLYVVYIQDNVPVGTADGSISRTDFLGYHGAFAGHDAASHPADVRYVVIPYPGGGINNLIVPGLSTLQSMTEVSSHEVAEGVTDPNVDYSALGWYDDPLNDEVADIVNQDLVVFNGYVVQRVADKHDQGMTPIGAMPLQPVSFDLLDSGKLYEHTAAGWTYLQAGVASISSQSIDNDGTAMIDVVLTNGDSYEYHDGEGWVFLAHHTQGACAGQCASYVLGTDGRLREYNDDSATWSGTLATNVVSIDAGTDRFGVNMVDFISRAGVFFEYSDTTGLHPLCSNAKAVSAGAGGVSLVLLKNGEAYEFTEISGGFTHLAAHIAHLAVGTDPSSAPMFDLVSTTGVATEYRANTGWQMLSTGVATVGKARHGLVDVVYTNGNAYEHTAGAWTALTTTVRQET
jgi:hypothetical protein